jgi:glycosyltransferase involved in cell wall biosynthesis
MGNVIDRYTGIKLPRVINQLLHKALPIVRKIIDMVRRVAFRRNLHTADEIVVVNQAVADYCSSFLRDERNISIIPYGVDIDFFEFTERDTECMDLVAIGLLKKRKGFADLLKAFSTVVNSHPDAHLHIFGKGPQRTALEQLASENGISEAVTFHGFVAHATIREFLTKCRMFIHPSHSEGYSHVRLEALASGCPIVGTDIAGADGMILDGETGLTVQPGDIDGLAESISQLMSKDELLTEMSHNARSHVEENYSFDTIGEKWVEVYQSALGTELY